MDRDPEKLVLVSKVILNILFPPNGFGATKNDFTSGISGVAVAPPALKEDLAGSPKQVEYSLYGITLQW